jgi:NADH:ubiquinone reductase (H+-translocating)
MSDATAEHRDADIPTAKVEARTRPPRIVIIGGGFGGISAARALRRADADVVLIDRRNHHIFQPLLYQVATALLAPSDVAAPIRQLRKRQPNLSVMLGEASSVNFESRTVCVRGPGTGESSLHFDYLVVAAGMRPSYFGHDEFSTYAPSLKTIGDAETIRTKILGAYELAELAEHAEERARQLTFVLVGAGPTGVELAASIAQMATSTLRSNFRRIDPAKTSIILIDAANRILPSFHETLSAKAAKHLERLGVKVITGAKVEKVEAGGVIIGGNPIASATVMWTAGVEPSPIVKTLGAAADRAGRICVGPNLNIPNEPRVFVVGDAAAFTENGHPLPGVAQVAIQQGRYVGNLIAGDLAGRPTTRPFHYRDKGNMAVVGKNFAILQTRRLRLHGFVAWLLWAQIHVLFLPQLQNRLCVQTQWLWSYLTGQRGCRLIPESYLPAQSAKGRAPP